MKGLIISLLIILTGSFIPNEKVEFLKQIEEGYNTFALVHEENTENYELSIYAGECQGQYSYSIYFLPLNYDDYDLVFKHRIKNVTYISQKNSKGGYVLYHIAFNDEFVLAIQINNQTTFSYELEVLDKEFYNQQYLNKSITGLNKGLKQTNLDKLGTSSFVFVISIVFASIIVLSLIILLVFFVSKKGLFNKEKFDEQFKEEHEFRDNIKTYINGLQQEQMDRYEVEAEEVVDEEIKNVYEKQKNYYDEERDITPILHSKGINTNYSEMSSEEKDRVMLELMKLKINKEITELEYHDEIIKLWM